MENKNNDCIVLTEENRQVIMKFMGWEGLTIGITWKQIMPIIEKVESIEENIRVVISRNACHIPFCTQTHTCSSKIEAVHKVLIEFIHFYNSSTVLNQLEPPQHGKD